MAKHIVGLPDRYIKLQYSPHALERLKDRTTGSLIQAPQLIKLTPQNSFDPVYRGKRLRQVTVRIENKGIYMFLPIVIDIGMVKTVYFKNVKKKSFKAYSKSKARVKHSQENYAFKEDWSQFREDRGTKDRGQERIREDVADVPRDMGRKESWWKGLFRAFGRIHRHNLGPR